LRTGDGGPRYGRDNKKGSQKSKKGEKELLTKKEAEEKRGGGRKKTMTRTLCWFKPTLQWNQCFARKDLGSQRENAQIKSATQVNALTQSKKRQTKQQGKGGVENTRNAVGFGQKKRGCSRAICC